MSLLFLLECLLIGQMRISVKLNPSIKQTTKSNTKGALPCQNHSFTGVLVLFCTENTTINSKIAIDKRIFQP
jgi:hypothetical protein